jgi:hypothetical protein
MRALALALFLASPALADEVELLSGTIVEGKVVDQGDSIKVVRGGASVVYPKSMVRKIVPKKTVEDLYEERSKGLRADDLDGRLRLARWCVDQHLAAQAVAEFKKAVALSPDHEEARLGAGFLKLDGKWVPEEAYYAAKGMVRHKGRWVTPEQRDLDVALEEQKELERILGDKVKLLLERMKSADPKKRESAVAELAPIADKFKAKAYVQAITFSSDHVRAFVYPELGRMKELSAAKPLARKALWDDEESLRPVAWEAFKAIGHPDGVVFLAPYLGEQSVTARTRCVELIAQLKDPRIVPALVQALENSLETEKAVQQYGQQMTVMTNRTLTLRDGSRVQLPGVVRVQPDFTDKAMKAKLDGEQAEILAALAQLTGEQFGEDPARWRAWIVSRRPQPKNP